MTISYSGSFLRLLLRWKGSIWKSTWQELLIYICLYYLVRAVYVVLIPLIDDGDNRIFYKHKFETVCVMFDNYSKLIPLTFLLGFYVSNVVARWWRQFESLNWPEDLLSQACLVCPGDDEKSRKRRHQIARYLNLSTALAWRDISSKIRFRFPNTRSIVTAGLMTEKEYGMLEEITDDCANVRWMAPLHWIQHLIMQEVKDNNPPASIVNNFLKDLGTVRIQTRRLFCYDWVCVPLPYTQVAALATYAFFFFCLFGRQFIDHKKKDEDIRVDLYVPIFTIVQFLFFVGWFKIGQDLMRPFGLDDDDIELNYIFERNLATSFAVVHSLQDKKPPMEDVVDDFWKMHVEGRPVVLAPSEHSLGIRSHAPKLHSYIKLGEDDESKMDVAEDQKCAPRFMAKRHLAW